HMNGAGTIRNAQSTIVTAAASQSGPLCESIRIETRHEDILCAHAPQTDLTVFLGPERQAAAIARDITAALRINRNVERELAAVANRHLDPKQVAAGVVLGDEDVILPTEVELGGVQLAAKGCHGLIRAGGVVVP